MNNYKIKQTKNGATLYEGVFSSFQACLEQAVIENTNLKGADLRRKNLSAYNLDSAQLSEADFSFSNLNMANLSEGDFAGANFFGASMIGACLAESNFTNANFLSVNFGGNILTRANFDHCLFSTLSSFQLPFADTISMQGCCFYFEDELLFSNSKPPVVVTGLTLDPIIISESSIHLGHRNITCELHKQLPMELTNNHKMCK